jgi:hypothetical protein
VKWLAEYAGAPSRRCRTEDEAVAYCAELARQESDGRQWDWFRAEDGSQVQMWTDPHTDRPRGEAPGRVSPLRGGGQR